jgi:hypothetical protein
MSLQRDKENILEQYLNEERETHAEIIRQLKKLTTRVANGESVTKKGFRLETFAIYMMGVVLAIVSYFYIDDRTTMREAHERFTESLTAIGEIASSSVATSKAIADRLERDHNRYERNFDKLKPDKPRFDYQDHEQAHHRRGESIAP